MDDQRKFFTVCFEGDVQSMGGNLFKTVSPFGKVVSIGVGNEFAARDELEERLSLRDTFLSEKGLWHEFATTMLPRPAALESSQKETA